ncbi:GntR family transcriptional regulator [Rhodococcus ruber]|uniref:GntR family transcriptional regulator n=2 Tax=Rhodococcus TaxID=1827 RepID=A0A098BII5_9NOCA|nr:MULTISPECIES: GntR family transcriptional regulator [Rhodococcus]MDX5451288.1 GntR family transcriptional regulator [Rhodococcus sp. (in: high G+C Gram-positive bacteria)]AXY51689.1 GntR family transcriptional regulator [Rhodococcus ruber]MCD2129109.1 GntR family transcriptional regulator [Rhodococcus ruber]MCZ1074366.1 GntR family transcriptional regulator [Rhodococcus sp. A5(2022)]MCZ4505617.1 GntR family transcriptional regulator [Rhodococcus ruber]
MAGRVEALSIVDALALELRRRVFAGELTHEDALTEAEVSRAYEVARPTAKAAIEKLVGEGLLQRSAHKTARVPHLGPEDVRDIYRTRAHLESVVLRTLAETRTAPPAAAAANAEIAAMTEADPLTVVEPDMRFHTALVDALGSPRTSRMFGSLVSEVRLCMVQVQGKQLLTTASIAAEHQQILDAVLAGDGEAAVEAITRHLGRARERLVAALGGNPGPEATLPEPA